MNDRTAPNAVASDIRQLVAKHSIHAKKEFDEGFWQMPGPFASHFEFPIPPTPPDKTPRNDSDNPPGRYHLEYTLIRYTACLADFPSPEKARSQLLDQMDNTLKNIRLLFDKTYPSLYSSLYPFLFWRYDYPHIFIESRNPAAENSRLPVPNSRFLSSFPTHMEIRTRLCVPGLDLSQYSPDHLPSISFGPSAIDSTPTSDPTPKSSEFVDISTANPTPTILPIFSTPTIPPEVLSMLQRSVSLNERAMALLEKSYPTTVEISYSNLPPDTTT